VSDLDKLRAEEREKEKVRTTVRTLKEAIGHIEKLETELEAVHRLHFARTPFSIKAKKSGRKSEATAVAVLSDVHIGNVITLAQTNGINEYSVEIAKRRCTQFFERVVRLTNKERQDVHIGELILVLNGDMIDGALHMDVIMSNEPSAPMLQAVIAQNIIEAGLNYLREKGDFDRITIVAKDGNHGRTSTKQHWNSRIGNSLEWYMYYNLAARYPDFNWVIEESFFTYLKVYDYMVRFHHGDTVFFGGQNGFYQNLHIRINGNNAVINAQLDVLSHLHQYTPMRRYVVNGSVVGYSPYAMSLQSFNKGEPPTQAFFLIDRDRFTTVHIGIQLT